MPQQQIDINVLVNRLMDGFEDYMRQREGARTDYLGGMREENQALLSGLEGLGGRREQAVAEYEQPYKPGTKDYILAGLSAGLPLLSMGMKKGRGRDVVGGAGALAAGVQRGGIQARRKAKEEGLRLDLGGLEQEAELLGAKHKLGTGYGKAEYDTQIYEYPERMGAMKDIMGMLPKAEKPPFTPGQLYQQDRNAAADARREEKGRQASDLVSANRSWKLVSHQFLSPEKDFDIKTIQDVDYALKLMQSMEGMPSVLSSRLRNVVSELERVRDEYYGGTTPMLPIGGTEAPLTPEEKAELEARRQRR